MAAKTSWHRYGNLRTTNQLDPSSRFKELRVVSLTGQKDRHPMSVSIPATRSVRVKISWFKQVCRPLTIEHGVVGCCNASSTEMRRWGSTAIELCDQCICCVPVSGDAGACCIGATLYVTMVTCHHHFWKLWWLSPPLFQSWICSSFPYSLGKRIVFFLLPEAFYGQKYAENAIAAGAPTRTPLGELTTLPQTP